MILLKNCSACPVTCKAVRRPYQVTFSLVTLKYILMLSWTNLTCSNCARNARARRHTPKPSHMLFLDATQSDRIKCMKTYLPPDSIVGLPFSSKHPQWQSFLFPLNSSSTSTSVMMGKGLLQ